MKQVIVAIVLALAGIVAYNLFVTPPEERPPTDHYFETKDNPSVPERCYGLENFPLGGIDTSQIFRKGIHSKAEYYDKILKDQYHIEPGLQENFSTDLCLMSQGGLPLINPRQLLEERGYRFAIFIGDSKVAELFQSFATLSAHDNIHTLCEPKGVAGPPFYSAVQTNMGNVMGFKCNKKQKMESKAQNGTDDTHEEEQSPLCSLSDRLPLKPSDVSFPKESCCHSEFFSLYVNFKHVPGGNLIQHMQKDIWEPFNQACDCPGVFVLGYGIHMLFNGNDGFTQLYQRDEALASLFSKATSSNPAASSVPQKMMVWVGPPPVEPAIMVLPPSKPTYNELKQFDLLKYARSIDEAQCNRFDERIMCAHLYHQTLSTFIGVAGEGLHFWAQDGYWAGMNVVIQVALQNILSGILHENPAMSVCNDLKT